MLECGFSVERIIHDYGVDLLMFTYTTDGEIENGHVEFQLKATDRPRLVDSGRAVALRVAWADINFWQFEPQPVILVLYDATRDQAFWVHVQNYVASLGTELGGNEQVTIRIPLKNGLDRGAIQHIRDCRDKALDKAVKGVTWQ